MAEFEDDALMNWSCKVTLIYSNYLPCRRFVSSVPPSFHFQLLIFVRFGRREEGRGGLGSFETPICILGYV